MRFFAVLAGSAILVLSAGLLLRDPPAEDQGRLAPLAGESSDLRAFPATPRPPRTPRGQPQRMGVGHAPDGISGSILERHGRDEAIVLADGVLLLRTGRAGRLLEIDVDGGMWSVPAGRLAGSTDARAEEITLEGHAVELVRTPYELVPRRGGRHDVLVVRRTEGSLRVRDARSGFPLDAQLVHERGDVDVLGDGPRGARAERVASRVGADGVTRFSWFPVDGALWATSEGYAWTAVDSADVTLLTSGALIELEPAGRIEVQVTRPRDPELDEGRVEVVLFRRREHGGRELPHWDVEPAAQQVVPRSGTHVFEAVSAGDVLVAARCLLPGARDMHVFASQALELMPGETRWLALEPPQPEIVTTVQGRLLGLASSDALLAASRVTVLRHGQSGRLSTARVTSRLRTCDDQIDCADWGPVRTTAGLHRVLWDGGASWTVDILPGENEVVHVLAPPTRHDVGFVDRRDGSPVLPVRVAYTVTDAGVEPEANLFWQLGARRVRVEKGRPVVTIEARGARLHYHVIGPCVWQDGTEPVPADGDVMLIEVDVLSALLLRAEGAPASWLDGVRFRTEDGSPLLPAGATGAASGRQWRFEIGGARSTVVVELPPTSGSAASERPVVLRRGEVAEVVVEY